MSYFIRCPSCGFCFAPYIDFFEKAKLAVFNKDLYNDKSEYKDYNPDKLALNPGAVPAVGFILDALNIKNICCRTRMLTIMNFDKLYK